jgi:hypothetical protein
MLFGTAVTMSLVLRNYELNYFVESLQALRKEPLSFHPPIKKSEN